MSPPKIDHKSLGRIFADVKDNPQEKFCFLLGAGASKSSGIPTGAELARQWYEELKNDTNAQELARWREKEKVDEQKLAESYSQIYQRRFKDHPSQGYSQLQNYMEKAEPNIGYSLLAQILASTNHKFVITTNFDHMMEDSLRAYTDARPLVCVHESLATYINAHSQRPTIIKVHRDLLFEPFNEAKDTSTLANQWQKTLEPIVTSHALVVLGYGGNDGSLMDYLSTFTTRKPIYWCSRQGDELNPKITQLLQQPYDRLVEIEGFDEYLLNLNNTAFKLQLPINFENLSQSRMVKNALARAERYQEQFEHFAEKIAQARNKNVAADQQETANALVNLMGLTEEQAKDWWQWQLKIDAETDSEKQQQLYQTALSFLPENVELNSNYAIFLKAIRKDYDQAEQYYLKALAADSDDANKNGNYAGFLLAQDKKNQAEPYLNIALASTRPDLLLEC